MTDIDLFLDVFAPIGILYALATGLVFGSTIILYLTLKYQPKVAMTTTRMSLLTGGVAALAGTLFFAGQVVQAIATDPLWPRAVGRMALWEVFAAGIGMGLATAHSFAERRDTDEEGEA